jgi:hypothetical protein
MLTIVNFDQDKKEDSELPVVIILARSHPGETVSSWILHHLIRFLISSDV